MSLHRDSFASGAPASDRAASLSERLAAELAERWRRGERPCAEEYLQRYPDLWRDPEAAADLIYEEVCLRQDLGEAGAAADALRRFPQWRAALEMLFRFHQLLDVAPAAPRFPRAGERLGEFELLEELGHGAHGRVFLAAQPALAGRLVVLKLTPRDGLEHVSLARLQHSNIVPIHAVLEDAPRHLRLLCMPYFGGTTLAHFLATGPSNGGPELRALLDGVQATRPTNLPAQGMARQFLARASRVQAICWLGAQLADALQYAHEHGLVHLDVKPSNILLAADGQPMLLDFHLARAPLVVGGPVPEYLGGTLTYMSPEQRAALDAVEAGQPVPAGVDGRSDVYSLGLVLHEALGGMPGARLDRCNPAVSRGLADIIRKCLADEPQARYAEAGQLAHDLRCHLADLPLRGVRNRSLGERWRKLRRRRPQLLRLAALTVAVFLAGLAVALVTLQHFGAARAEAWALLERGQELRERGQNAEARALLEHGLGLARELPFHGALERRLIAQLHASRVDDARALQADAARLQEEGQHAQALQRLDSSLALVRGLPADHAWLVRELTRQQELTASLAQADDLHRFVDAIRLRYGTAPLPGRDLDNIVRRCHATWRQTDLLLQGAHLPAALRRQVSYDLLDLVILWMDLRLHRRQEDRTVVATEALEILKHVEARVEAAAEVRPGCVLERERRRYALLLGRNDEARAAERRALALEAQTAWEHYALGRALLRDNRPEKAAVALREAVRLQPSGLWPQFYHGLCAYRLGEYREALAAFTACIALAPGRAECYYNRALAHAQLGSNDAALADYNQALVLAPRHGAAALNRGALHLRAQRYEAAEADFRRAQQGDADPGLVHYNLALLHQARGERATALRSLELALQHDPQFEPARVLHEHLRVSR